MNLQECLTKLARGKLSNLSYCNGGFVKPEFFERVIDAINESLSRLYTIFNINEESVLVTVEEGVATLPLKDKILYVTRVYDNFGQPYTINNPEEKFNISVTARTLTAHVEEDIKNLQVFYRVKHKELTTEDLETDLEIPDNLIGALLSYAAYLLHSDMNTEVAIANAQKYLSEYQMVVNEVIQQGTINPDTLLLNKKFNSRGFI